MVCNKPMLTNSYVKLRDMLETSKILITSIIKFYSDNVKAITMSYKQGPFAKAKSSCLSSIGELFSRWLKR